MDYICNDCGEVFNENDAEVEEFCYEDDLGVGYLFPDKHSGTCLCCPECGSSYIEEYVEPEEEPEEDDYE